MQKTLSYLFVATFALSSLVPNLALAQTAPTPVKTTVVPAVKKAVVAKKTTKKPAAKTVVISKATKPAVPAKPASGAIASVSAAAVSVPVMTCMQAVKKANTFCAKIAKGCSSTSVTPKCVAANNECEEKQNAALALCPAI